MRIGISAHFWPYLTAGSGQYLRHLVAALARLQTEHTLLLIGEQGGFADGPPPLPFVELPRGRVSPGRPAKLWFEQVALPRAARRLRLDLLHVPYLAPPLLSPLPTIVTVHDLIPLLLPAYRGNLRKRAYTWLALQATRRAAHWIAVSEHTRRDLVRHLRLPEGRVSVTHEAAAPDLRPATPAEVAAIRQRYDLPDRFLLYLGDSDIRKGVHHLLRAFARWQQRHPGQEVVVALAGPRREPDGHLYLDLPALARSLGIAEAVRFLGPIPEEDKPALLSAATVLALLSTYEGFGLPPLEAMACGTAVLAGNTSSLPEVVGEAGVLVEPTDEEAIATALERLLGDDAWRASLEQKGLRRAATFSWERTARQTMAVYEQVLRGVRQ